MAFVSLNRDNVKDAENWISKALSAWAKESGGHEKATGFIIRGNLAEYCKDYELSEQYYLDALGIYKELESEENISKVLNWLGNSALFQGQHDKAEQYYIEAKQKTKELSNLACYNYNLGNLELSRENWEAAKTWLQESLQMAIEADLQEVIASSYLGLARVREEECSYAKAITNVENAARIFERLKHRELKKAKNLIFRLKQKISPSSD
jgi:tetratricopeptide (TPR) repeat protein